MNAIEILSKELTGKEIVLYVPIIEGSKIDSLFSIYPDWWERGIKYVEVRRKIAFVLEANGTYKDRHGADYILQLDREIGGVNKIPCYLTSKLTIV